MSIDPALEEPRADVAVDAVTISFGDPRSEIYGVARVGLGGDRPTGLAVLFRGAETADVHAGDGDPGTGWDAGVVRFETVEPLRAWRGRFVGDRGGFELELEALGEPAPLGAGQMDGYEQLCRVRGGARAAGQTVTIDCLGQRGHTWGSPSWSETALVRSVSAWMDPDLAVLMSATRSGKAAEHDAEHLTATVLEGSPVTPIAIEDPRLSTTYDGDGRHRRAGFELWTTEEAPVARRGAGEVVCGTSVDVGELRWDCAFLEWRMEDRVGVGRYDILRRA